MNKLSISDEGLGFIKKHEGFSSHPYLDVGGVPTIGYGTTRLGALAVTMSTQPITEAEASRLLRQDIDALYGAVVDKYVTVPLTQGQYDALVSFAYNLGNGALIESTLLKKLNKGDYAGAAEEFHRWDKVHGKVIAGLTHRRKDEEQMFLA